jgi:hypothetical protein
MKYPHDLVDADVQRIESWRQTGAYSEIMIDKGNKIG